MEKENRKYYTAYDERYQTAHEKGMSWEFLNSTPLVMEVVGKYHITADQSILEIGCGEGRDSRTLLENGFRLRATDCSPEAIRYCKKTMPEYEASFSVLDCLTEEPGEQFDFIYAVAVIHMLVLDEDRKGFYQFVQRHLKPDGIALICTMGDGVYEMRSDPGIAFEIQEREHESGKMMVAATSCRMVSFPTFERELRENRLEILEKGMTEALPNFNSLMYAVVGR